MMLSEVALEPMRPDLQTYSRQAAGPQDVATPWRAALRSKASEERSGLFPVSPISDLDRADLNYRRFSGVRDSR